MNAMPAPTSTTTSTPAPTMTATRLIPAPPAAVADAVAGLYGLGNWLCDSARVERRAGGAVTLSYTGGPQWHGHWTAYEKPGRFGWHVGDAEGRTESADFTLQEDGDGTRIDVVIVGDAVDEAAQAAWEHRLDDLAEHVKTGRNARLARRPMLGVAPNFGKFDATDGAHLSGAVPGGGAEKAGLKNGDIIVKVGDETVTSWEGLSPIVARHSAGDTLPVTFVRDGQTHTVDLTLGGRPEAAVPGGDVVTPGDLRHMMDTLVGELRETLDGISDAEADFRPGPAEWSVREVLGHLLVSERHAQLAMMLRAADEPPVMWPGGPETALQGILAGRPLAALQDELLGHLGESLALAEKLFDAQATSPVRRYLAESLAFTGEHVRDHIGQIKGNVAGARAALPTA